MIVAGAMSAQTTPMMCPPAPLRPRARGRVGEESTAPPSGPLRRVVWACTAGVRYSAGAFRHPFVTLAVLLRPRGAEANLTSMLLFLYQGVSSRRQGHGAPGGNILGRSRIGYLLAEDAPNVARFASRGRAGRGGVRERLVAVSGAQGAPRTAPNMVRRPQASAERKKKKLKRDRIIACAGGAVGHRPGPRLFSKAVGPGPATRRDVAEAKAPAYQLHAPGR